MCLIIVTGRNPVKQELILKGGLSEISINCIKTEKAAPIFV